MKKAVPVLVFLFVLTVFLFPGGKKALAEGSGQISCGDYELVTRKWSQDGKAVEAIYKLNNKTGDTWVLESRDVGWVKLRDQQN